MVMECVFQRGDGLCELSLRRMAKEKTEEKPKILRLKEVCAYLGCCRPTATKYIREGKLKGFMMGRGLVVLESDMIEFARDHGERKTTRRRGDKTEGTDKVGTPDS